MTEQVGFHIKAESSGISAAKEELEKLTKAGSNAERATDGLKNTIKKIPKEAKAANDTLDKMTHYSRGLGYQLQDVAVQMQAGTDKFIILGQQGPQIASVFGPAGIVAGALIAAGAAIVGVGQKSGGTTKELKELEENALQLNDAFGITSGGALAYNERLQRLATTAPSVADAIFRIKTAQLELEQTLTEGALRDSLGDFESLTTLLESRTTQSFEESKTSALFLKSSLANLTDEFGGTTQQVIAVSRALENFGEEGNKDTAVGLVNSLSQLKGGSTGTRKEIAKLISMLGQYVETSEILAKSQDPFVEQNKSIRSMVESLSLEAETLGKTNRERDLYIAKQGEATTAQYDAINAAYDQIEAEQSASVIEKLQQRLLSEEEKIDDSYMRRREIIMANTVEGSEQQNELLRENWDAYEAEYGEFQDRLYAKDEQAANKRERLEAKVSQSIIRQKEGVVNSGIALLKNLASGNEKAAKAMIVVEAGLNMALAYQKTAVASLTALAIDPTGTMSARVWAYGGIQMGIIAANAALNFSSAGGGGASISSATSNANSSPYQAPPTTQTSTEDARQPVNINFYGDVNGTDPAHLVEVLREHLEETDALLVTVNSRNGQELKGAF